MWTQPNFVDFARSFVVDIDFHCVPCEHVSLEQKSMIGLERVERFIERPRGRLNFGALNRRQVVKVFIDGVPLSAA
jgi:hypothetical protein